MAESILSLFQPTNSINFYELFSHTEVLDSINICVSAFFVLRNVNYFFFIINQTPM